MKDIELVIKIPNKIYEAIKSDKYGVHQGRVYDIIRNGKVIPKGHGRLIDADALKPYGCDYDSGYRCDKICYCDNCTHQSVKASKIDNALTIIEADGGAE